MEPIFTDEQLNTMSRENLIELMKIMRDQQRKTETKMQLTYSGVRPHKEKINISKEFINKTRRAVAPYAARMNHTPLRGEQQATIL